MSSPGERTAHRQRGYRAIARNAAYLISAQVLSRGLRIGYMVVAARVLGPEVYGVLGYAMSWQLMFMPLARFGTGRLLIREVSRDRSQAAALTATTLSLRLVTGPAVALICAVAGWWGEADPLARALIGIFAMALAARGIAGWTQQMFLAVEEGRFSLRQEGTFRLLEALIGLSGLALGGGALWIAWTHALSWVLQAVVGLRLVHRRLQPIALRWHSQLLRQVLHDGAHGMLVALCAGILIQGGLILLRRLGSPGGEWEVGQLAAVTQVLALGTLLPLSLATASLPVLSRFAAEAGGDDRRTLILMLRLVLLGTALVGLLGLALGPWAIAKAMGGEYADAGRWLGPALWLVLPLGLGHLLTQYLYAQGAYAQVSRTALTGATTLLLTLPPLAEDWGLGLGAPGVLLAMGLGSAIWAAAQLGIALGWASVLAERALVRSGAAAALALVVYVFPAWELLGDATAITVVRFGAGLSALGLGATPGERAVLWQRLRSALGRV